MARRLLSSSCLFLLSALFLAAVFGLSGCGGGSPATVTIVKPSSTNVDPGQSVTLTANITNDSKGVTWSMTGTGCTGSGCGTLTDPADTATYTAPSTVATAFTVTITATAVGQTTKTSSVTLNIPANPAITTVGGALAAGQVGSTYTVTLAIAGGISPYAWSVSQGNLPTGLTIGSSTGIISGTPSASGTYNFTLKVADSGSPALTATAQFSIVIAPAAPIVFTTTSLSSATYNVAYTATVAATGGAGALTYKVTTGSLPAGLTMSSAGAISGTPTAAGTANFTVTASDAYGDSAQQNLSITVNYPAIVISPAAGALPGGQYKVAYSQNLTATGGSGSGYTWSVTSGAASLTAVDVSVSASGAITGTPQATGNASFTAQVTDSYGDTQTASYTIAVTYPALSITSAATLPVGVVGVSYGPVTLAATGGSGAGYSWSVTSGTALSATSLALSTAGVIAGTPTTAESAASVTVQVQDSASNKATATLSLTVYSALTITSTTLPNGTYGVAYSTNLAATGGDGSSLKWSTTSGTALTSVGLSLSSAGLLSGTPPSPQNAPAPNCQAGKAYCLSLSVTAVDSDNAAFTTTASAALTLVYPALAVSTSTLPSAVDGSLYSQQLAATGGSGTGYTWTTTGTNNLSTFNLALSTAGVLSGTPPASTTGTATFTAKVTDSFGNTATANLSVTVNGSLTITTTSVPYATTGTLYSVGFVATGGSGGYTWSTTGASNLATFNLTFSSSGTLSGTPSSTGTVSFTAQVKDSSNATATQPISFAVYNSLAQNSIGTLPVSGTTGVAYSGTITAVGGSGNYSWTVTGLSDNLTSSATGGTLTISGTPGSAATVSPTVKLTDTTTNAFVSNGYTIVISNPPPLTLPSANPTSLGSATVNQIYSGAINSSGGVSPFTWKINGTTVTSGNLSLGNGLNATNTGGNTLNISGTPTSTGSVTLTNVTVTDSESTPVTAGPDTYTITVNAESTLAISFYGVPQGMVNMPYTLPSLDITGGLGPYTVTYSNLPAGLQQSTSDPFWVVGTPTAAGSTTVTVDVTDSSTPTAQHQSATFTLPVVPETVAAKNSELSGQYACYFQQYWPSGVTGGTSSMLYRGGAVLAFTANGSGGITGGELDTNSPHSGYKSASTNGALGGTYVIGSDDRGYLLLTVAGQPGPILAVAGGNLNSSSQFSEVAFTEMDDVGATPSGNTSVGQCYLQNTSPALNTITLSGSSVFGLTGEDGSGILQTIVGSVQFGSGGGMSFVQDMAGSGGFQGDVTGTGTITSGPDAYGRVVFSAGPTGDIANPTVMYITNNSGGAAMIMTANPHNASNDASFLIGQARRQNATALSASYPLSGKMVMYTSGLDTSPGYKAQVWPMIINSSTGAATLGPMLINEEGTFTTQAAQSMNWTATTDPATGRTPFGKTGALGGDVLYVYDTGAAVVLLADGCNGCSTIQDQIGWVEPQTAPTSGTWTVGDAATTYFSTSVPNGDPNKDFNTSALTINSSGTFTYYASDGGEANVAAWDEPICTDCGTNPTGSFVLDTTYDPTGNLGIFDVNVTAGTQTGRAVYCVAVSVDKATNANTKGRSVCLDPSSGSPTFSIVQE